MVLSQIKGGFPLQVREELLLQVEEFKYLRMFFVAEGRESRDGSGRGFFFSFWPKKSHNMWEKPWRDESF